MGCCKNSIFYGDTSSTFRIKWTMKKEQKMKLRESNKVYLEYKEKEKIIGKYLGVIGYKFSNGPFRYQFVRFAFDPRAKENKKMARPLQIIDYRINKRDGKKLGLDTIFSTAGTRNETRGKPKTKSNSKNISLMSEENECGANNDDLEKQMMDRLQFKIKPNKLMTCYQLKNIKIDKVQHIINNLDAKSFNEKCELSTGWLMKKDDIRIRELMKKRLAE